MSCVANVGQGGFNARRGGFNVGQDGLGLGGTRVYDDAETAAVIQTAPSYPAQVSIIDNPDIGIGDGGNSGFGGILTTVLPLLLLLGALGGGTTLKASPVSPDPVRPPVSSCPVCPTLVPRTCPSTREQCNPKAACPEGFSVVANANPNKCYLVGSDDVKNYGAASAFCASRGGSLFEHESSTELDSVRTLITEQCNPKAACPKGFSVVANAYPETNYKVKNTVSSYYLGFSDVGNTANDPVRIHSGRGLPAPVGSVIFDNSELDCVSVKKTGEYSAVTYCSGNAKVLCEERLVSKI
ncbi:unnamed protein product [Mytilus edulis]|uniref:C-type lectin domain-containing protein n=1 Tax=Mytilus edulis TaxID=6550 RepID=A0A8S3RMD4_MYTED|nr:unnamed protein product [Mytilus edulis]